MLRCSQLGRLRKDGVVHGIDNWLRSQSVAAKVATVQTLKSLFATGKLLELDVNLTLVAVAVDTDVDGRTEFFIALLTELVFDLLLPVGCGLTLTWLASIQQCWMENYLLSFGVCILDDNAARHCKSSDNRLLGTRAHGRVGEWDLIFGPGKLAHQVLAGKVVEVDGSDVRVI